MGLKQPETELPFKPGDWVAELEVKAPTIGKVKECFADQWGCVMNIVVYSHTGQKIGRASPALDGPTTYEPAVPTKAYRKIKEPQFPLKRDLYGHYAHRLEWL